MTQNSSRTNYRSRSFVGQNLTGFDFSYADIRGANFSGAVLRGANFTHCKAGLPPKWNLIFQLCFGLLALTTGYVIGYSSALPAFISSLLTDKNPIGKGLLALVTTVIFVAFPILTIRRGIGSAIGVYAVTCIAIFVVVAGLGTGDVLAAAVLALLGIAGAVAGLFIAALLTVFSKELVNSSFGVVLLPVFLFLIGAIPGFLEGTDIANSKDLYSIPELAVCVVLMLTLVGLGTFVGQRASNQDSRYALLHTLTVNLCTSRGTRFKGTDLTNADFSHTTLRQTDLRYTTLTCTNFFAAKGLSQSRLNRTYLENPTISQLVISGQGQGQNYDGLDLRGVNLKDARLVDASFIGANLSEANLQGADLSRAKLVQTRLYRANLNDVCFTGAYIEDWGISVETQLDGVKCDYIYMHLPTNEDPDPCRKPDNRSEFFEPGDFADFITPIIKTLDLYRQQNVDLRSVATTYKTIDLFHHQGIDPSAAAIAFQQLAEQHPEAGIEIVALEGRGNEKIRLQARVSGEADRSELSTAYFQNYTQLKSLPFADLQSLLTGVAEKDEQIRRLEEMLESAIRQPRFYVETYQNQGEFVMSQNNKGNINIGDVGGSVSGLAAAGENLSITGATLGEVSGTVTQTINQLPEQPGIPEDQNLKALLTQIQAAIESEPELSDEDKVEALEQVKVLAEAGQSPEDGPLKRAAKTSIKILKGTAATLPNATKLVEEFNKFLPAIATLLVLL